MDFSSSEFINQFHFLRPLLLLGLLPALILFGLLKSAHRRGSSWKKAIDPQLLPYLLERDEGAAQKRPLYTLLVLWCLAFVALAGPVWKKIPVPVQEREDALVVVMDLSLSMYSTDLSPNRLVRTQRKLIDLLNSREEGLSALVVYAGDAHVVTPLTDDVETINTMVPSLSPSVMPAMGSKPDSGISLALQLLENAGIAQARILLMTDGIRNQDIAPINDLLLGSGHSLSVMGIGTEQGAPIPLGEEGFLRDQQGAIVIPKLERERLQALAQSHAGRYADIRLSDEDIEYLLARGLFAENQDLVETEREFDNWYEAGPWLLLLLLPFCALAFRKGWLLCLCLLSLGVPEQEVLALGWQDLWRTRDQQAAENFQAEDFGNAAQLFKDEAWKAAAHYRHGNYQQALENLSLLDDTQSHYNRGNVLARLGQYPQAIAAYDEVLAREPEHADALHNKAIVEKLLEEQEQSQQNQGDNQDQQQQDQQGEEQQQESDQEQSADSQQQDAQQEQEQQENQDQQQNSQDNQQQQNAQDQEQENQDQEEQEQSASESEQSAEDSEEQQAMEQWLRRIPDDPGELLRKKFHYQTQQRLFQQMQNPNSGPQEAEQIW